MHNFCLSIAGFVDTGREEAHRDFPSFFVILTNHGFYKIMNNPSEFIGDF